MPYISINYHDKRMCPHYILLNYLKEPLSQAIQQNKKKVMILIKKITFFSKALYKVFCHKREY